MKRFLLALASGTSLLLFIASLSMWVRSYRGGEGWTFAPRKIDPPRAAPDFSIGGLPAEWYRAREVVSADGSVQWSELDDLELHSGLTAVNVPPPPPPGYKPTAGIFRISTNSVGHPVPGARRWSIPGVEYVAVPTTVANRALLTGQTSLIIRWWLITSLSALLPLVFTTRLWKLRRSARRRLANLCLSCGYDLRASTDRCPECGTPIEANPICRDAST